MDNNIGYIKNLSTTMKQDDLNELNRLAEIGQATELACKDGSKYTVFRNGIEYLLEWYREQVGYDKFGNEVE